VALASSPPQLQVLNESTYPTDAQESSQWFLTAKTLEGLALVTHGLNLRPSKMNSLVSLLNDQGYHVLRLSLPGHRSTTNNEEQKQVTLEQWSSTYELAYKILDQYKKSLQKNSHVKLKFIALNYSLGSLIHLDWLRKQKENPFEKNILIAPAAWTHDYTHWIKWFFFLPRWISIPSKNHEEYRAFSATSLASYQALHKAMAQWKEFENKHKLSHLGSFFFILNPEDELISLEKTQAFWRRHPELSFTQYLVKDLKPTSNSVIEHLIIDEKSVGKRHWEQLSANIISYIKSPISE